MKSNIIIGNGINIQFDKQNNDWSKLGIICQKKFKDHIYNLNKDNPILNSIYKSFKLIEKHIKNEKYISLENYVKFFNIFYYKEILNNEFEIFACSLWKLLNNIFSKKTINKLNKCPKIDFNKIYELSFLLFTLEDVYKRIFKNVIFDVYKINKIKINQKTIKYINDNFDTKITLNYDNNLKDKINLIYLHGQFDNSLIKWNGNLKIHQKNIINQLRKTINPKYMQEYLNWSNKNVIQEDLILRNKSSLKCNDLFLFSNVKKNGYENEGWIENTNIDFNKVKVDESLKNYEEILSNLSGKVILIGVNLNNDELILEILSQNKNVKKIIIYGEKNYIFSKKIKYKHFSKFWKIVEKENIRIKNNLEIFQIKNQKSNN